MVKTRTFVMRANHSASLLLCPYITQIFDLDCIIFEFLRMTEGIAEGIYSRLTGGNMRENST